MNIHAESVNCTWHGPLESCHMVPEPDDDGTMRDGPPVCPHCASKVEKHLSADYDRRLLRRQEAGATNLVKFMEWLAEQSQCWPTLEEAADFFTEVTGEIVVLRA